MNDNIICPNCGMENYKTAQFCQRCGLWIGVDPTVSATTTVNVSHEELIAKIESLNASVDMNMIPTDEIALQVLETGRFVTTKYDKPIIFGRFSSKTYTDDYFIDLTEHGGHNLGVSREHAKLTYTKGDYWITDLNSSNGTRLGKERLKPNEPTKVSNGNVIYFGRFPVILRYKTLQG